MKNHIECSGYCIQIDFAVFSFMRMRFMYVLRACEDGVESPKNHPFTTHHMNKVNLISLQISNENITPDIEFRIESIGYVNRTHTIDDDVDDRRIR